MEEHTPSSDTPTTDGTSDRNQATNNNRTSTNNNKHHQHYHFEGARDEIIATICLPTEQFNLKTDYEDFIKHDIIDYSTTELTFGEDIKPLLKRYGDAEEKIKQIWEPTDLTDTEKKDDLKLRVYMKKLEYFLNRTNTLKSNLIKVWAIIIGQCSPALKSVIEGLEDYEEKEEDSDVVWLLKNIKSLSSGVDVKANKHVNLADAICTMLFMKQYPTEDLYA